MLPEPLVAGFITQLRFVAFLAIQMDRTYQYAPHGHNKVIGYLPKLKFSSDMLTKGAALTG